METSVEFCATSAVLDLSEFPEKARFAVEEYLETRSLIERVAAVVGPSLGSFVLSVCKEVPLELVVEVQFQLEGVGAKGACEVEGVESTQADINDKVSERFAWLCGDMDERKQALASGDTEVLLGGFWYPTDYYFALAEHNFNTRKEWMIAKGLFFHGMSPKNMKLVKNESVSATGVQGLHYVLSRGKKPTAALDAVKSDLCFIDGSIAYEIALYDVIRELWGDEKFNRYFSNEDSTPFALSSNFMLTPLRSFIKQVQFESAIGRKGYRPVKKGQVVVFNNHPHYATKHILGKARWIKALCVDETPGHQRFIAPGLSSEGVDEDTILNLLTQEYNVDPVYNFEIVSSALCGELKRQLGASWQMSFTRLSRSTTTSVDILRAGGGFAAVGGSIELDLDKVSVV